MVVLGLVYVPINQSACGVFIYVGTAIPEISESTNTVIVLLLLECGAIIAECWLLSLSAWVWSMGIAFSVLFGMNRLRMKQKSRGDAKLRMAHEEIEQLAKTAERERIARDMHDVHGHSLSLIVLKSELAGRLLASQPARAALEIAEIETTARQALAEVRRTISGYRSEGFASELTRAAQILETAGVRSKSPAKAPYLTLRHEATLSLVLREAVTNIVRHAGASECSIRGIQRKTAHNWSLRMMGEVTSGRKGMDCAACGSVSASWAAVYPWNPITALACTSSCQALTGTLR